MNTPMIEIRKVTKTYRKQSSLFGRQQRVAPALNAGTMEVRRGEVLSVLGPSGCGKTTLLRLVAGLETPDSGEIVINGRIVTSDRTWVAPEHRNVGLVFQDFALFPHLTVARNIAFPLKGWPADKSRGRVAEMLSLVKLAEFADRYPHELSGGQQQRVALARALAPGPSVLLLDEPFSNLDAESRVGVRDDVREILREVRATALFVTHDQEEALIMGDRVAVMNGGRIEQVGSPEEIFHEPATRFVAEFMGLSSFLPGVVTASGIDTEFGLQPHPPCLLTGEQVEMLVRPDDLTLSADPAGSSRVVRSVFRGMDYLYDVALPSGRVVRCLGAHTERYAPGTRVMVELTPGHALNCFACGVQERSAPRTAVLSER